ncbi:MAG: hypothetical protein O2818_07145 [Bacteroidetes bacterium]|nr:hypothetical protein [Bacteroidota bacterium]
MIVSTINIEGAGNDTFFKSAKVILPCPIATIRVYFMGSLEELIRPLFTCVNNVDVTVWKCYFAVAP